MQPITELSCDYPQSHIKSKSQSSHELNINTSISEADSPKVQNEEPQNISNKYHLSLLNDTDECLGYKKVYQTQYTQEEKEERDSNESETKQSNIPSRTTQADSNISSTTPTYHCFRNDNISFFNTRKMSSPMCSYYNSSHKFLSEMLEKNLLDFSKSNNYIKKRSFVSSNPSELYKCYIPSQQKSSKTLLRTLVVEPPTEENNVNDIKQPMNNINENNNNTGNTTTTFNQNIPLPQMINFSIFCQKNNMNSNIYNKNDNNKMNFRQFQLNSSVMNPPMERKKHKPFTERAGDWVCYKCKNLNFAFRVMCNRCHLAKNESEKMAEKNKVTSNTPTNNNNNIYA